MKFNQVEDGGNKQEFSTGSKRSSREGKGRFDLIPSHALTRLAQHFENGAKVYGDRNWERGQPLARYLDSAMRHLVKYLGGGRSEDHIIACAWNCFAFVETQKWIADGKLPSELDDMNEPDKIKDDVCNQGWYAKERELAREALGGVTLYLKGEPIHMPDWKLQPWMIPFLKPPKPRTLWQRFMARIGR